MGETIYIRETKAPEGYDLSSRIVKAELLEDGQLFIDERLQTQNALTIAVPYADRKSSPTPQPGTNPRRRIRKHRQARSEVRKPDRKRTTAICCFCLEPCGCFCLA
ncbi:hypothetical protein [Allobaculum sp. Allo2]|uniref:hypothetical protein n=1 Tax=Allobaculum sp. Allo2 TaxID=2853432 RepID=UPI003461E1E3